MTPPSDDAPVRLVVGRSEMWKVLDCAKHTPYQWSNRNVLPPPDHEPVNGKPTWTTARIIQWAHNTHRPVRQHAAHLNLTNQEPSCP